MFPKIKGVVIHNGSGAGVDINRFKLSSKKEFEHVAAIVASNIGGGESE